jgi:lysozyme family protein
MRVPTRSISAITKAKVEAIFHDQYWMPGRADVLPVGIDCAVFDAAVSSWCGRRWAALAAGHQRAVAA